MPPSCFTGQRTAAWVARERAKMEDYRPRFLARLGTKVSRLLFLHCVRPAMFGDIGGSHALDERLCGLRPLPEAQMHAARLLGERLEWVGAVAEPDPNFL